MVSDNLKSTISGLIIFVVLIYIWHSQQTYLVSALNDPQITESQKDLLWYADPLDQVIFFGLTILSGLGMVKYTNSNRNPF
jgi:hypothetical protein